MSHLKVVHYHAGECMESVCINGVISLCLDIRGNTPRVQVSLNRFLHKMVSGKNLSYLGSLIAKSAIQLISYRKSAYQIILICKMTKRRTGNGHMNFEIPPSEN